jgi:uncharacterized membrane protein
MEPKRTKYDTNPLDGKVADRADKSREAMNPENQGRPGAPTEEVSGGPTRSIARTENEAARANPESESPTRRIDESFGASYPSIFVPPKSVYQTPSRAAAIYEPRDTPDVMAYQSPQVPVANIYQPPPVPLTYKPASHKVSGLGIPEKWAVILPYIPFYLAIVAAIVELLLVPRTETRVRYHAAQGLALQIGITLISTLLTFGGLLSGRYTGAGLFSLVSSILLVIAMIRVWQGKPLHIPPLDEPTKWLDSKIKPRK